MNKLGELLKTHEIDKALQYAKNLSAENLSKDYLNLFLITKKVWLGYP